MESEGFIDTVVFLASAAGFLVLLIAGYRRSRQQLFLWLAAALVAWPMVLFVGSWVNLYCVQEALAGRAANVFPFSLMVRYGPEGMEGTGLTAGEFLYYLSWVRVGAYVVERSLLIIALISLLKHFGPGLSKTIRSRA
jgi:hypothetical protein